MDEYKTCTKCGQIKLRTSAFFFRSKRSPDGLRPDCAECGRVRSRQYSQQNAKANRLRSNTWRINNPERKSKANKLWYEKNKTRIRNEWKQSYAINPEKHKVSSRVRRARVKGVIGEPYTWFEVIDMWGASCHICGKIIDLDAPRQMSKQGWEQGLHMDHVVPISKGGSDTLSNVKPAHGLCNIKKNDKY